MKTTKEALALYRNRWDLYPMQLTHDEFHPMLDDLAEMHRLEVENAALKAQLAGVDPTHMEFAMNDLARFEFERAVKGATEMERKRCAVAASQEKHLVTVSPCCHLTAARIQTAIIRPEPAIPGFDIVGDPCVPPGEIEVKPCR